MMIILFFYIFDMGLLSNMVCIMNFNLGMFFKFMD